MIYNYTIRDDNGTGTTYLGSINNDNNDGSEDVTDKYIHEDQITKK